MSTLSFIGDAAAVQKESSSEIRSSQLYKRRLAAPNRGGGGDPRGDLLHPSTAIYAFEISNAE